MLADSRKSSSQRSRWKILFDRPEAKNMAPFKNEPGTIYLIITYQSLLSIFLKFLLLRFSFHIFFPLSPAEEDLYCKPN